SDPVTVRRPASSSFKNHHRDTETQRSKGHSNIVIPAKAGIHPSTSELPARWIPAFAGMTFCFSLFLRLFFLASLCLCVSVPLCLCVSVVKLSLRILIRLACPPFYSRENLPAAV